MSPGQGAHDVGRGAHVARGGHVLGFVNHVNFAAFVRDLVRHVGGGLHQVDVRLVLQSLLDDFHVQQTQKAASKTEAESFARLRLEFETRVIDR